MGKINIGGQAVIEGIMMRSPKYISTVIRRANGELENKTYKFEPITKRFKILGLPIIRGFVSLVETMKIGVSTLNWSGDKAIEDEKISKGENIEKKEGIFQKIVNMVGSSVVLLLALALFMYIPYLISDKLKLMGENELSFNLLAGIIRIVFLVGYIYVISLMEDVKRVFQYHGAEHKSIYCFEKGKELTVENVKKESRFHPRCGTSFILIVAINTILLFAILDTIIVGNYGEYSSVITRVLTHLMFIPLVAGISFEVLKLSDKFSSVPVINLIIKPGLWLQKLTTREPDEKQIEVGIESIKLSTKYLEEEK
ncbi:MAG: hypothetical protein CR982_00520 [Candidatus Cloacimonadota bacterium]|nr:MAG: hypothetical protein CR982_00520 [Candidatus Cloacimonadota bacterium]PIE78869.1 MAG: hypothetical protein CSA15_05620 [Candidatus Delongbacteria bacterium]